ncbi:MAG: hypothetical protein JZU52_12620 [Lamprocystis purpurea]|nr:hypothetical protein [Lamprocystis purpurea]
MGRQIAERGWIIVILADLVVGAADAGTVRNAMRQLGVAIDGVHFRNHLSYLEERGYLRIQHHAIGQISNALLSITANGRDLRAGIVKDAGVDPDVGGV